MPRYSIYDMKGTQPGSSFRPGSSGYEVKDEAKEMEGEPVIVKRVNSAFIGTDLESRLRAALAIQTVVICGATTNHCVETSTRMACNLGFDVWLVRDATWTFRLRWPRRGHPFCGRNPCHDRWPTFTPGSHGSCEQPM